MGSFDKKAYDQQYNKDHVIRKTVPFNREKADDMELLAYIEGKGKGNFASYVKALISDDMKKNRPRETPGFFIFV